MAELTKGERVQAIDENGHWAEGFVQNILLDKVEVSFKGWSQEFNRNVAENEIRKPCLPLEERIRGESNFLIC